MTLRTSRAAVAWSPSAPERTAYGRWHTPTTLVCWASVTKVLVAGATWALVRDRELHWDEPIGEVLGVPAPAGMTIAALVEHRSGLPRTLPEQKATQADPYVGWTVERFDAAVFPRLEQLATQGTGYSNVGYALLGRVLEVRTGRGWLDLVRERLIAPLGVSTDAFVLPGPPDAERQVALSRDLRGRPVPEWDVSNGPFAASGGLAATLPAMSALLRAAAEQDSPLLPGDGPHAWARKGTLAWHSGALLRCGSLVVFSPDTGGVGVAHALGGIPGWGSRYAEKALGAL